MSSNTLTNSGVGSKTTLSIPNCFFASSVKGKVSRALTLLSKVKNLDCLFILILDNSENIKFAISFFRAWIIKN